MSCTRILAKYTSIWVNWLCFRNIVIKGCWFRPFCWWQPIEAIEFDWTIFPWRCSAPHNAILYTIPIPGSPDQCDLESCWKYTKTNFAHQISSNQTQKWFKWDSYLSRMHDTNRLSTSAGSIFSSVEMKGIAIRVYGRINLIRTCVRMLRNKSGRKADWRAECYIE